MSGLADPLVDTPDDVLREASATLNTWSQLGTDLLGKLLQHIQNEAEELRRLAEKNQQEYQNRLNIARGMARPVIAKASDDRWWNQEPPPTGQEIGEVWEVCAVWACSGDNDDLHGLRESALRGLSKIRDRLTARDLTDEQIGQLEVAFMARAEGVVVEGILDPQPKPEMPDATVDGVEGTGEERSLFFVITDTRANGEEVVLLEESVLVDSDPRLDALRAAERMEEFVKGKPEGNYTIRAFDGDRTPVGSFTEREAAEGLRHYKEWAQGVLASEGNLGEKHLVRSEEVRSLRKEFDRVSAEDDTGLSDQEQADIRAKVASDLAAAQLELEVVAAKIRGEDGSVVREAAWLHSHLDRNEAQFLNASPEFVGEVLADVSGWAPGAARDGMLKRLQTDLAEHHGFEADPNATPVEIAERVREAQAEKARQSGEQSEATDGSSSGRDRAAEERLEEIGRTDPEAAKAATAARPGFPVDLVKRLNDSGKPGKSGVGDGPGPAPKLLGERTAENQAGR